MSTSVPLTVGKPIIKNKDRVARARNRTPRYTTSPLKREPNVIRLALLLLPVLPTTPSLADASWPALQRADWQAYGYEMQFDDGYADYVIVAEVRATGKPAGRIAFNIADESNYLALDLTRERARFIRIESGLELPIGESFGKALAGRQELHLRRHGARYDAYLSGRRVASATDSTFVGGKTAVGSLGKSVEFSDFYLQETEPILLEDDFMRAAEETGGWETVSGEWEVQSVGSPTRSTNAFNLSISTAPKGALTVCGGWFWRDYEVSVSCQPHGEAQIGLVAYYSGPKAYTLFACGKPTPKADSVAQLVRVAGGKPKVIASAPLTIEPHQWYRLGLHVEGDHVTGLVDGRAVVDADSEGLVSGQAGLYAKTTDGATFDDFSVHQSETLTSGSPTFAAWHPVGGEWRSAGDEGVIGVASSDAKLMFGERLAGEVSVSAAVSQDGPGEVGLVANWQDEANYDMLTLGGHPAALRCTSVRDGQPTEAASAPVELGGGETSLEFVVLEETLIGRARGVAEIHAPRPDANPGKAGLLVRDGEARFASASVCRVPSLSEVANFEGSFSQEVSMADWAAENSDWITADPQTGDPGTSYWHRATAYGDREMSVRMASAPSGPVSVMIGASTPAATDGYRFTVTPGGSGSATLLRSGQSVGTKALANLGAGGISLVGLHQHGPLIVGSLNGKPTVVFEESEPLSGRFSGWVAPPGSAEPSDAYLRAENVLSYNFRRAPADWWTGGGEWKITNRWDCEPRWTFFVGGGSGVSSLWNKHEFGDDVTLDFYGAIRFDSTKGYSYPHAANINCTIAADGRDLTSGYSLIYGGWDNQYTRLLRGSEVVAESTDHLITRASSIHRRWFNLRIHKAGDTIRCFLDGTQLFEYTDPDPLPGKHVALWTHDNAITLARCRISSNEVSPGSLPPPDRPPLCVYDVDPAATEAAQ